MSFSRPVQCMVGTNLMQILPGRMVPIISNSFQRDHALRYTSVSLNSTFKITLGKLYLILYNHPIKE